MLRWRLLFILILVLRAMALWSWGVLSLRLSKLDCVHTMIGASALVLSFQLHPYTHSCQGRRGRHAATHAL